MSDSCCSPPAPSADPRYRRILWIALALNFTMFGVEIAGSLRSSSVSLLADAIDFLGDAANYGISLAVLGLAIGWRARASLVKAACMAAFGTFVVGRAVWSFLQGGTPEPLTMGAVAILALAVNVGVALMLYGYRTGDSNMRSVWICSRNDAFRQYRRRCRCTWRARHRSRLAGPDRGRRDVRPGTERRLDDRSPRDARVAIDSAADSETHACLLNTLTAGMRTTSTHTPRIARAGTYSVRRLMPITYGKLTMQRSMQSSRGRGCR